jgi:uncharacterized protein
MNNPKFQIFKGNNDKFYFRLYAINGQQVLSSQGYTSKASCKNGAESVQTNAANEALYESKESSNGKYYFNLLAANQQVIGSSQMYESKSGRDNGIGAVKRAAEAAKGIEDTTV